MMAVSNDVNVRYCKALENILKKILKAVYDIRTHGLSDTGAVFRPNY